MFSRFLLILTFLFEESAWGAKTAEGIAERERPIEERICEENDEDESIDDDVSFVPYELIQILVLEWLIDDLKTAPEPERTLGEIHHLLLGKLRQRLLDGYSTSIYVLFFFVMVARENVRCIS